MAAPDAHDAPAADAHDAPGYAPMGASGPPVHTCLHAWIAGTRG